MMRKLDRKVWFVAALVAVAALGTAFNHLPVPSLAPETGLQPARPEINTALFSLDDTEPSLSGDEMLVSQLCTQSQFETPVYARWLDELRLPKGYHCRHWEWIYILQALSERGMLRPGKRGLGFGVGQEQLPALFAKYGVEVVATDLELAAARKLGWAQTNQHMSSIEVLNKRGIAPKEDFDKLVKVMNVDMNNVPGELTGFDFIWSTCALGHLGNLEKGLAFIENSLKTLKPGGIAVHTTEFNLSSDSDTYETTNTSVYRKRDIKALVRRLTAQGHEIHVNYNFGSGELDRHIDKPPYSQDKHIKIQLNRFVITPIGLLIRKSATTG